MKDTRIVFFGTPEFSLQALQALHDAFTVTAVVTQPDRPCGRGRQMTAPPVKCLAESLGIPVMQPRKIRTPEFLEWLTGERPHFLVTAAYGRILPAAVLAAPAVAPLNIHASLLPRWRGAAPIHRAVMSGDSESGITIMYMDEGMDTGDIILQAGVPIGPESTSGELHDRLAACGATLVVQAVRAILDGTAPRLPQDERLATEAPPLQAAEEEIDWCSDPLVIHNRVRGLSPWPGAHTWLEGKRLKVREGEICGPSAAACGTVLSAGPEGITVAASGGAYRITRLQPQGKKVMDAADFLRGNPLSPGTVLGK
jgi:methionyl-tRNA formyltransferase